MRIYRSNPMDAVKREPDVRGPLAFGVVAALVLAVLGVWADRRVTAERAANVERAVAAQGFGRAHAVLAETDTCGRARRLYRWEAEQARGVACAGPRDRVEIREVVSRN